VSQLEYLQFFSIFHVFLTFLLSFNSCLFFIIIQLSITEIIYIWFAIDKNCKKLFSILIYCVKFQTTINDVLAKMKIIKNGIGVRTFYL